MARVQRNRPTRPGGRLSVAVEQIQTGDPEKPQSPHSEQKSVVVESAVADTAGAEAVEPPEGKPAEAEPDVVQTEPANAVQIGAVEADPADATDTATVTMHPSTVAASGSNEPASEPPTTTTAAPAKTEPESSTAVATPRQVRAATSSSKRGSRPSAREAVDSSFLTARLHPGEWENVSVRVPDDLQVRLVARMVHDRKATKRPGLGVNHYVNAALATIPAETKKALAWAEDYLRRVHGMPLSAKSRSTRVHRSVREALTDTEGELRLAARYGLLSYLQAEAIRRFLDRLDAEDPMPSPSEL